VSGDPSAFVDEGVQESVTSAAKTCDTGRIIIKLKASNVHNVRHFRFLTAVKAATILNSIFIMVNDIKKVTIYSVMSITLLKLIVRGASHCSGKFVFPSYAEQPAGRDLYNVLPKYRIPIKVIRAFCVLHRGHAVLSVCSHAVLLCCGKVLFY